MTIKVYDPCQMNNSCQVFKLFELCCKLFNSDDLSMSLCLQSKSECFCGAGYGKHGLTGRTDTWCSVTCPGDGTQYCGGWGKSSVYNVNGKLH